MESPPFPRTSEPGGPGDAQRPAAVVIGSASAPASALPPQEASSPPARLINLHASDQAATASPSSSSSERQKNHHHHHLHHHHHHHQQQQQQQDERWTLSMVFRREAVNAALCIAGLTLSLTFYGVLQERIMTLPFGSGGSRFRHSLFLVLCNRGLTALAALAASALLPDGRPEPVAPLAAYGAVSLANVVASTCQYEALKYVSFPVQVIAKCTKMLPVMVWQTAIGGKRYSAVAYTQASVVAAGCAVFLVTGNVAASHAAATSPDKRNDFLYLAGGSILLLYLSVDGFTSTWQDRLFSGYQMDLFNQVLYTSLWSVALSFVGLVATGRLGPAMAFVSVHPEAWWWIGAISLASTGVQFFAAHTIKTYGALVFATVMTTRQWFSILLSCLVFAHPLSVGQWLGTGLVFGALYHRFYYRKRAQTPSQYGHK